MTRGPLAAPYTFLPVLFLGGNSRNTYIAGSVHVWGGEGMSVVTMLVESHHCLFVGGKGGGGCEVLHFLGRPSLFWLLKSLMSSSN